jgi:hypothetical protein
VGFRFPFIFYDIHLSLQLFPENNLFTCFSWIYRLERESGFYFNMRFFEDLVLNGGFDEAEEYLYGFTDVHDNMYSTKIIFEIRKQKFLETLDE